MSLQSKDNYENKKINSVEAAHMQESAFPLSLEDIRNIKIMPNSTETLPNSTCLLKITVYNVTVMR